MCVHVCECVCVRVCACVCAVDSFNVPVQLNMWCGVCVSICVCLYVCVVLLVCPCVFVVMGPGCDVGTGMFACVPWW